MKRFGLYLLLVVVSIVLETVLLPRLFPIHLKPDLLLVLTVQIGLQENYLRGGLAAFSLGSLQDVFAGHFPGLYAMALLLTFLVVRGTAGRLNTESSLLLALMAFCGSLVEGGALMFSLLFFVDGGPFWPLILRYLLPQAVVNLLAALVLLKLAPWLQRRLAPRVALPGTRRSGLA